MGKTLFASILDLESRGKNNGLRGEVRRRRRRAPGWADPAPVAPTPAAHCTSAESGVAWVGRPVGKACPEPLVEPLPRNTLEHLS